MSTKINISYQDKEYTLEYTRASVKQIEALGFVVSEVEKRPFTMIPILFYGAFVEHHKISKKYTDEIMENIPDFYEEDGLLPVLIEMYTETVQALTSKKDASKGNAVTWKVQKG